MRWIAIVAVLSIASGVRAQPGAGVAGDIDAARKALTEANYARAAEITNGIVGGGLSRNDLMEAWRIRGLALFFLQRLPEAEEALLEFLELDPLATMDPALVPPEAIAFLEQVRNKYEVELEKYRPKPKRKRYWWLNLVPVAGQIQNRDTTKAWILGSAEGVLLAANVGTFVLLKRWCDGDDDVCETPGGRDRNDAARAARIVNAVSGAVLIGVAGYGIIDAFIGHRRISRAEAESARETMSVGVFPTDDGGFVSLSGRF